ncbi:MAG: ABC transporter substrate-binding protein [Alphaproteobacteria bacterium]|nr:ABC transporter substrate-binding protein [Alphaproteobacteria bacterium]
MKFYAVILGMIMTLTMATTPAVSAEAPIAFVNALTDDIITNVLQSNDTQTEKLNRFRQSFEKALDMKSIGQFVLGAYWRKASNEERTAFLNAFIDFTTKTWADRFDSYTGQQIIFSGTRNAEGKNQLYVNSTIENNPPVEVIWRLKQTKTGDYQIIDIIVEGVSMAMSYRNEYSAFLQKHGGKLPTLIQELEQKSADFKFTDKE